MQTLQFQNRTLVVGDEVQARTLQLAARAATTLAPVLICGESGTGKELIARFIHEKSARAGAPFVSINCAAIPEGLIESELFGYERGAFTGAITSRLGKFERANGGTLLLDEVSEMPLHLQAKLLRVLQEGEIDRLGGERTIPVHVRIIATTNREPLKLIQEENFRADLFYRLNVLRIDCQPLRGRSTAIETLTAEFLARFARAQGRVGMKLSEAAARKVREYAWPGNVRELQNAVERAVLLADGNVVGAEHFELQALPLKRGADPLSLADLEQNHILRVLESTGGNRNEAAERLGISVRTLRNKLNEYSGE